MRLIHYHYLPTTTTTHQLNYPPPRSCSVLLLSHWFNGLFSRTTWVSQYQKSKTSLDLNTARDDGVLGWQWHQLDYMQSAPRFRQITTPTPHHSMFGVVLLLQYAVCIIPQRHQGLVIYAIIFARWRPYSRLCDTWFLGSHESTPNGVCITF